MHVFTNLTLLGLTLLDLKQLLGCYSMFWKQYFWSLNYYFILSLGYSHLFYLSINERFSSNYEEKGAEANHTVLLGWSEMSLWAVTAQQRWEQ